MAILTLKVKGQTLTVESEIDRIVENSINYLDFCIVCDDENWEDLARKVIVTYDKKAWEAFTVIPSETIHSPGFTISVIGSRKPGTNGENDLGEVVTTYPVAVKVFPSGATDGSDPEDTAIDFSTADELNAKITENNSNLSSEMNELDEKIETVNSNLSSTIEGLDEKIKTVNSNLSSTNQTINQSIEELEKDIEENYLHSNQLKVLIDENSTNLEIPTAKAVYEFGQALQADNDSSTIKTITTPCYIADLDVGTYLVNGTVLDFDNELGQVIIQNVTPDGKINDRYFILFNGIISITQKYIVNEDDTEERIAISFTASGNMSTPDGINITETTDKDGNIIMKETIATTSFSSSVSYIIAEYVKPKVDNPDKGYVAGQWYNEDLFASMGDISCEALTEEITSESTRFKVPTAKAVYDCVEALKAEIMGGLDEIGDLIGGEDSETGEEIFNETLVFTYDENGYYSQATPTTTLSFEARKNYYVYIDNTRYLMSCLKMDEGVYLLADEDISLAMQVIDGVIIIQGEFSGEHTIKICTSTVEYLPYSITVFENGVCYMAYTRDEFVDGGRTSIEISDKNGYILGNDMKTDVEGHPYLDGVAVGYFSGFEDCYTQMNATDEFTVKLLDHLLNGVENTQAVTITGVPVYKTVQIAIYEDGEITGYEPVNCYCIGNRFMLGALCKW